MKNMYKKFAILFAFLAASCSLDGDLENPNQVPVSGADVNYLMNQVQLGFADFFNNAQGTVAPLVRHTAMTGGYRYQTAFQPQFQNGLWSGSYQDVLVQAQTLIPLAEDKNLTTHVAVAKILSAFTWITLADFFSDIPMSEALKGPDGSTAWNPSADSGEDVYDFAIGLIEEAKTELAKTGPDAGGALDRDIYYSGDRAKWTALANTLELKAWVNLSMIAARKSEATSKITALLAANIIDTPAENFTYKYSATTVPSGSRHPLYDQYYGLSAGSAGGYIGNQFMYEMYFASDYTTDGVGGGASIEDPRWRYYFYRQVGSILPNTANFDQKAIGCTPGVPPPHYISSGTKVFCVFDPGFYGRDHGDASGTPPDGPVMTCAGVYPAGGRPDVTSSSTYNKPAKRGDGADGAGILPIWMSFFTDFVKAEIASRSGDNVTAKAAVLAGVANSIAGVKSFADSKNQYVTAANWIPSASPTPAQTTAWTNFVNQYTNSVGLAFDAASNKLDIIGLEYWKALWGNGLEAYNLYRRTSAPRGLQPTIQTGPGPWMRRLIYPASYVNLNGSATQLDANVVNKVFWDTNTDTLN